MRLEREATEQLWMAARLAGVMCCLGLAGFGAATVVASTREATSEVCRAARDKSVDVTVYTLDGNGRDGIDLPAALPGTTFVTAHGRQAAVIAPPDQVSLEASLAQQGTLDVECRGVGLTPEMRSDVSTLVVGQTLVMVGSLRPGAAPREAVSTVIAITPLASLLPEGR